MPAPLGLILGGVLLLAGLLLLTLTVLGASGLLRRNRFAGIKTPATLASDAAFAVAHRAAAVPLAAAAAVGLAGGALLLSGVGGALAWTVLVVSAVGLLALAGVGGLAGDRAALAAAPEPMPACAGSCAGCDLVAGCRDR